jgi:hypothetical protein
MTGPATATVEVLTAEVRVFKRRGRFYYRDGDRHPWEHKRCEGCGTYWMLPRVQRFCSVSCAQTGSRNNHWAGTDGATYSGQHQRVRQARGRPVRCAFGCAHPAYHWAFNNVGDRDCADDYLSLCARCHKRFDSAVRMMQRDVTFDSRGRGWAPSALAGLR